MTIKSIKFLFGLFAFTALTVLAVANVRSLDAKGFATVNSYADVDKCFEALRAQLDVEDMQLMQMAASHMRAYLNARTEFEARVREELFLTLVRNRSPREIIVLGFFLHAMALERTLVAPTIRPEDDSPEYRASLLREAAERREGALAVVSRYIPRAESKGKATDVDVPSSKPLQ